MNTALFGAVAAGAFCGSWVAWTGRWKRWACLPWWFTAPLHLFPSLAMGAILALLLELFGDGLTDWVAMPLVVAGLALFGVYLLGVFWRAPRWSTPQWYRDHRYDPRHDVVAVAAAWFDRGSGGPPASGESVTDSAAFERAFLGKKVLFSWTANWVYDTTATERAHVLAGAGSVAGHLGGSLDGVAFFVSERESNVRRSLGDQREFSFLVERSDLAGVSTVPRGADGQGRRPGRWGPWRHSAYRRLVVHTRGGDLVLETLSARRRADTLSFTYGIERRPDR